MISLSDLIFLTLTLTPFNTIVYFPDSVWVSTKAKKNRGGNGKRIGQNLSSIQWNLRPSVLFFALILSLENFSLILSFPLGCVLSFRISQKTLELPNCSLTTSQLQWHPFCITFYVTYLPNYPGLCALWTKNEQQLTVNGEICIFVYSSNSNLQVSGTGIWLSEQMSSAFPMSSSSTAPSFRSSSAVPFPFFFTPFDRMDRFARRTCRQTVQNVRRIELPILRKYMPKFVKITI